MIRLRLSLPCPANRRLFPVPFKKTLKSGRMISMATQALSKEYRVKQHRLVAEVWKALGGRPQAILGHVQVFMVMTPRDKRTADCDAYFKAVLDGLAKANVYADDKQVVQCSGERLPNPTHPGFLDVEIHEVP